MIKLTPKNVHLLTYTDGGQAGPATVDTGDSRRALEDKAWAAGEGNSEAINSEKRK